MVTSFNGVRLILKMTKFSYRYFTVQHLTNNNIFLGNTADADGDQVEELDNETAADEDEDNRNKRFLPFNVGASAGATGGGGASASAGSGGGSGNFLFDIIRVSTPRKRFYLSSKLRAIS